MRSTLRILAFVALLVLVCLVPHIVWRWLPARALTTVIVDKTVPFTQFREHAAIPWLLHALKIRADDGRFLDPAHDYLGFDPITKTGTDLAAADVEHADVLLLTDTYGVYTGDYARPGEEAALERSPLIYGGVTDDEARVVEGFAARGGLVIAEFNTFASPTAADARTRLEGVFGVRWTKWVGRYWPNLRDASEVPSWIGRLWEKKTGTAFDMGGGGLVFVREDEAIIVLRAGVDLREHVVSQEVTGEGAALGIPESASFWFWMDVVTPIDAHVLSEHVIDVTSAGAAKLHAMGMPLRFPAVMRKGTAWYLAGDFVDSAIELGTPELAGLLPWKSYLARVGGVPEERFFWGWYAPIVGRLLSGAARTPR